MLNHNWKANCDWSTEDGMEITALRDISGRVDKLKKSDNINLNL